jgi:hypothetical protein
MNDKWSPREVIHRDYSSHPPAYAPGYKTSVLRSPRNAPDLPAELAVRDHRPGL